MPKTIVSGFDELQSRLNITALQTGAVASRHTNVRDAIKADFATLDDFLTGSYRRSTMILPLKDADVDVMVVLHPSYHEKYGATALLERLRAVLLKSYTTPKVSRSGQAVTITFSDFKVDVVVGYNRSGGGYLIANSYTNAYLSTDPKKHVELWSTSNTAQNGMLVPLIKMLKGWNRENGGLLRSFHLEVMARAVYEGGKVGNYPGAVKAFFEVAERYLDVTDPAGYGGNVGSYLSKSDRGSVVSRFSSADARAKDALDYANRGSVDKAYERWGLVFGNYWPAYG